MCTDKSYNLLFCHFPESVKLCVPLYGSTESTLSFTGLAGKPFLPFLRVFLDDMGVGKIEVNGGDGEPVVSKDVLKADREISFSRAKVAKVCLSRCEVTIWARLAIR